MHHSPPDPFQRPPYRGGPANRIVTPPLGRGPWEVLSIPWISNVQNWSTRKPCILRGKLERQGKHFF